MGWGGGVVCGCGWGVGGGGLGGGGSRKTLDPNLESPRMTVGA